MPINITGNKRFLPPDFNQVPANDYMMAGTELVLPFEPSPSNLTGENELFAKISEYDKQSMPENWIGPTGSGGYASNWRHAGNTALLKNQIANVISPYVGDKIGSTVGGIGSFGGGLLHELTSDAAIFDDERRMVDEALPFDVGPSMKLNPEFKSDILANLYGSWKGKTGIADTAVLENLLTDMSKDDAWSAAFANLIEEEEESNRGGFDWVNVRTKDPRFWEPKSKMIFRPTNPVLDKQSWLKKMRNRKKHEIPILRSNTSNITRGRGGGGWSPSGGDSTAGGGYGQSPTGSDIAGTPFSRGGILGAF